MVKIRKFKEANSENANRLLKVKIYQVGSDRYELQVVDTLTGDYPKSSLIVKGDQAELRRVLMRLKASDTTSVPASIRKDAYVKLVQAVKTNKAVVWIWSSTWKKYLNK